MAAYVIAVPTMEQARKWCHSPQDAPALAIRLKAANGRLILVAGA